MAKKSEVEKQLAAAASLIGASHGRLSVMIARERANLADIGAIISDLNQSVVILGDLKRVLEAQVRQVQTVPAG